MKKYRFFVVWICIFAALNFAGCGSDKPGNADDSAVTEDDNSVSEPEFLSVCKTDNGDLIITITDDSVSDRINPDNHVDDYFNYYEDMVYEVIFYANEQIGIDSTYCSDEWQSTIVRLCVYGCGSFIEAYESDESGSRSTDEWEYKADWKNKCFSVDGKTLTLLFSGAGNVLDDSKAYVCRYQDQNGDWMTASQSTMSVGVGGDVVVASASGSNDYLNIGFIDDDTVYVTVFDDELTADSDVADYQLLFSEKESDTYYDPSGNLITYGEYELVSRFNDGGTYVICTFEHEWNPLDYYRKSSEYDLEHSDRETYTSVDPADWYGDAEIYDGHINMKFAYEDIKSILLNYGYVSVVRGWGENVELLGQFSVGDVMKLENYNPYLAEDIEPLRGEYVRPYDSGIFEPITPYYSVLSSDTYGPVANGMTWRQIRSTDGTPFYPQPPFQYAWGFMPEIDTERNGHAISTILESYDEFGNLVQSVLRIEYDSVEDLQWSHIHWNRIYYPYDEYGVDEPSMEYVNPDYYESERKLNIEEYALDAACLGVYENYIYYDLMGQYWNLERYLSCFDRWMKEEELENYYSDGSSLITQEVNPLPFHSAVEIRGNIDRNVINNSWYNDSAEIRMDLHRSGSINYVPDVIDGQGTAFVHDTTSRLDGSGGYTGEITGDTPTGSMNGYSHVGDIRRVFDIAALYPVQTGY